MFGLGVMVRSVARDDWAEYGVVVGESGGWVRMMATSLSQLVDVGEGGARVQKTCNSS